MRELWERETKWEVDRDFAMPELEELVPGSRVETVAVQLSSTYYDTVDRDLLAHRVTLRRRDGDDESGWQLKIPHGDGRLELSSPLSERVPAELAAVVRGVSLGKPLHPVTTIDTLRDRHRVLDTDGALIAEIADDTVEATPAGGSGEVTAWREVEIEAGPDTDRVPAALADALVGAGARPSRHSSKLGRVLPLPSAAGDGTVHEALSSKAGRALHAYLRTQIDALFAGDIALRRGRDPIHDTRVASRRLRSTLRVFGPLLDRDRVGGVEDELKWYAGVLGEVRDPQVQRRRQAERLAALPPELVLGPVAGRIEADLLATQVRARARVGEELDSERYLRLLDILNRWREDPPLDRRVRGGDLARRAHRAARKADRRLDHALVDQRDESLHRARKAAKRARYAAELRRPVDSSAKKQVRHYKSLQQVLGDHNDGVVAAEYLWRAATTAGAEGENGFTYGLLYAEERHDAEAARREVAVLATKWR